MPDGQFCEYKADYRSVHLKRHGSCPYDISDIGHEKNTFRGATPSGKAHVPTKYAGETCYLEWGDNDDDMTDEDFYGSMVVEDSTKHMMRRMRFSLEDSNLPVSQ